MDADTHEVKDHSLAMLRAQLPETESHLGPWLGLYQVHSATLESGILADVSVLEELARLRAGGVAVGLSVSGPRQADVVRAALDVRVDGVNPFGCVQATWNLLEPSAGPALAEARAAGWGVIVKEGLANGRLAPGGADARALEGIAAARGTGVDAVALAAVLANPWVHVALSGAATEAHVRANAAALTVALADEDIASLAGLAEPADRYWAARAARPWT